MIIKDDSNLARNLLENWGRWCATGKTNLGHKSRCPMFARFMKSKAGYPIDEIDAEVVEAVVFNIGLQEYPRDVKPNGFFSVHDFIVQKWGHNQPNRALADHYGVSVRTIERRVNRAKDEFLAAYLPIVRAAHKINRGRKLFQLF